MCKSHLRLLWIVTPNTLWASTDSRALVSMAKADGRWSTTLGKRKVISLHFLGLRTILFVADYSSADVVKFRLQNWHPVCSCKFWYCDVIYILPVWATWGGQFQIVNHYYKEYRTQLVPWGTPARTGRRSALAWHIGTDLLGNCRSMVW